MNIYIIGFMATGKSTVGRELARALAREFVDLDAVIEAGAGASIRDIFSRSGEPFFRGLERAALAEAACRDNLVIGCGGGIVLDNDNVRLMKRTGTVVCLTASVDEIVRRSADSDARPLLNAGGKEETARQLFASRAALYARAADITIDTTDVSIAAVVDKALGFIRERE